MSRFPLAATIVATALALGCANASAQERSPPEEVRARDAADAEAARKRAEDIAELEARLTEEREEIARRRTELATKELPRLRKELDEAAAQIAKAEAVMAQRQADIRDQLATFERDLEKSQAELREVERGLEVSENAEDRKKLSEHQKQLTARIEEMETHLASGVRSQLNLVQIAARKQLADLQLDMDRARADFDIAKRELARLEEGQSERAWGERYGPRGPGPREMRRGERRDPRAPRPPRDRGWRDDRGGRDGDRIAHLERAVEEMRILLERHGIGADGRLRGERAIDRRRDGRRPPPRHDDRRGGGGPDRWPEGERAGPPRRASASPGPPRTPRRRPGRPDAPDRGPVPPAARPRSLARGDRPPAPGLRAVPRAPGARREPRGLPGPLTRSRQSAGARPCRRGKIEGTAALRVSGSAAAGTSCPGVHSMSTLRRISGVLAATLLLVGGAAHGQEVEEPSVARQWNDLLLHAIRNDFARPTVHARNLFHIVGGDVGRLGRLRRRGRDVL